MAAGPGMEGSPGMEQPFERVVFGQVYSRVLREVNRNPERPAGIGVDGLSRSDVSTAAT